MDSHELMKIQLTGADATVSPCQWQLEDSFFEGLKKAYPEVSEWEIQGGKLDVKCQISGSEVQQAFQLHFVVEGQVEVACNRCLEPMTQVVNAEDTLFVKLGDTYEDDGETITIPTRTGSIEVAWNVYEMVALAVPINHVHPEGQCNPEMLSVLQSLAPTQQEG